jgi:Domain of unknown function (DUF4159)
MAMARPLARRPGLLVALAAIALAVAVKVDAQRRFFTTADLATEDSFDGRFQFCRVAFAGGGGRGASWDVDFPRADINLSIRLSELTKSDVSRNTNADPNHLLVRLTDPEMFSCPFIMMTEVGSAFFRPQEVELLRAYLLKGGFLWADDFWGTPAWEWWEEQLREVFPRQEYPIVDLDPGTHPLFRSHFVVKKTPQIASINHWYSSGGGTSERYEDSAEVHTRAILDRHGRVMVLMTHNTDFGDSFEREADDPTYFLNFSVPGYAFGINTLLYAMTH